MESTHEKQKDFESIQIESEVQNQVTFADEATEKQDPNFEPMQIGEIDVRAQNISDAAYFKICETMATLKEALEKLLLQEARFNIDEFFEFVKSDPERWIFDRYILQNNIVYPGMNSDRLFELKLIKIEGIEDVLQFQQQFQLALKAVKDCGFYYPLKKLYDAEENIFSLTTDFCEQQEIRFSKFTKTAAQNKILEKFNQLAELLNDLNESGIIRAQHGPDEIKMLANYFEISKSSNRPFVVDSFLFLRANRLSKYRIKDRNFLNAVKFENIFS